MDHQSVQEWILSGKMMNTEDQQKLAEHLAACPACRDFAEFQEQLKQHAPQAYQWPSPTQERQRLQKKAVLSSLQKRGKQESTLRTVRSVVWVGLTLVTVLVLAILAPHLRPVHPAGLPATSTLVPAQINAVSSTFTSSPQVSRTPAPTLTPAQSLTPTTTPPPTSTATPAATAKLAVSGSAV